MAVLTVLLRTEVFASDPWDYVRAARYFPDTSWVPLGWTRQGMVLPRLPLVWLFGNSEVTYYFWPVVSASILAASIYLIAWRFWGGLFAVVAVGLSLASPITFMSLSRGYPDIQSIAIFSLIVVIALVIRDKILGSRVAPWWLWLSLGLLLGGAFETRETTLLTWPVIAVILWTKRIRTCVGGLAIMFVGLLCWAVVDVLVSAVAYGDALAHLKVFTSQDLSTTSVAGDQAARDMLVGRGRWYYFTFIPLTLLHAPGGTWTILVCILALLGITFAGGARLLSLWFAVAYVTIVGLTGGISPDHPSGRIDIQRYWICFLVPAGLAAAGTVAECALRLRQVLFRSQALPRRAVRPIINASVAVIVCIGPLMNLVSYGSASPELIVNGANQLAQLRSHLAEASPSNGRIVTDLATARLMPIYQRGPFGGRDLWSAEIVTFNAVPKPRRGDLVAINSLDNNACYFCHTRVNRWYAVHGPIPDNWKELWHSDPANLVLYEVQ